MSGRKPAPLVRRARRRVAAGRERAHALAHRVLDPVDDATQVPRQRVAGVLGSWERKRFQKAMAGSGETPLMVFRIDWAALVPHFALWGLAAVWAVLRGPEGVLLPALVLAAVSGFLANKREFVLLPIRKGIVSLWTIIWRVGAVLVVWSVGGGVALLVALLAVCASVLARQVCEAYSHRMALSWYYVWVFSGVPLFGDLKSPRLEYRNIQYSDASHSQFEQMWPGGLGTVPLDSSAAADDVKKEFGPVRDADAVGAIILRQGLIASGRVPGDGLDIFGRPLVLDGDGHPVRYGVPEEIARRFHWS